MSEMIEKVARAICEEERMNPDDALGGWVHWAPAARAAIEAMREPTEAIMDAGPPEPYMDAHVWGKMIDAALHFSPGPSSRAAITPSRAPTARLEPLHTDTGNASRDEPDLDGSGAAQVQRPAFDERPPVVDTDHH
jgi:hypothetical protein